MNSRSAGFHHAMLAVLAFAGAAAWIWRSTGFNALILAGTLR